MSDRASVFEVRGDRRDDYPRLHGEQVNTDERNLYPSVDDNPLVKHVVENVDDALTSQGALKWHSNPRSIHVSLRSSGRHPGMDDGPSQWFSCILPMQSAIQTPSIADTLDGFQV